MIISNLDYNCSNFLDLRNLKEQVRKAFCYQKLFWPFTVWSSYLKIEPSASNFRIFSRPLKHSFLTVGQNNFGNKIPFLNCSCMFEHPTYLFKLTIVLCKNTWIKHVNMKSQLMLFYPPFRTIFFSKIPHRISFCLRTPKSRNFQGFKLKKNATS